MTGRAWRCLASLMAWWMLGAALSPVSAADAGSTDGVPSLRWEAQAWMDPSGRASLQQVLAGAADMAPLTDPGATQALGPGRALWLRYRLQKAAGDPATGNPAAGDPVRWRIEFPLPQLDEVTLYQRAPDGRWLAQRAGDTLAVNRWTEPGRFPSFSLGASAVAGEQPVYARIAHANPLAVPVRVVTQEAHDQRTMREYLWHGVLLGVMLLLCVACAGLGWLYSDRVYLWFALQVLVMGLGVSAHSGVASHLLWPDSAAWADAANGCLPLMAAAMILLLVREVSGIAVHYRRLGLAALALGLAGMVLAVAYFFLERRWGLPLFGIYYVLAIGLNLAMAWLTGRRGDVVGHWLLAAYVSPSAAILVVQLRVHGWLPYDWDTQHLVLGAFLLQGPVLLMALHLRSRARHQMQVRNQTLVSHDPLTGLLMPHLFQDRLSLAIRRARAHGDHAAVVVVELANLGSIRRRAGPTQAERSILRCAIKLRGLIKDVDTVSRIGEARFALILEGAYSRHQVSDFGTRLVASGLRSQDSAPQESVLRFHLAACLLREHPREAASLIPLLEAVLADMPAHSRRVIRFLESETTAAMSLAPQEPDLFHQVTSIR
ncbi:MAG: diguanylate cyclase [Ramlibacter sp.]|nr:diguanylate cyclase [Ramlibacter sp.]